MVIGAKADVMVLLHMTERRRMVRNMLVLRVMLIISFVLRCDCCLLFVDLVEL